MGHQVLDGPCRQAATDVINLARMGHDTEPLPDSDLDSGQPGLGIAVWLKVDDAQALHDDQ